ncbi:50S ribosomal protein L9 [bacterium]|nr:50S ribosomal protein L9 [bacterium]
MNVYLLKDIEKIGMAGEIVKVKPGFASNFLIPKKLGIIITAKNEAFYKSKVKTVEHRKDIISNKTSMLAEKIKQLTLTLKRKTHDDGRLYGAVSGVEVAELLAKAGIGIAKNQVDFGKSVKTTGSHKITIKLSSKLKPQLTLKVVSEK